MSISLTFSNEPWQCVRCINYCSPAYSTGLTVVLLLILVKQVANVTVILPELRMTLLASLLCLKQSDFTFILLLQTQIQLRDQKGKPVGFKISKWSGYLLHRLTLRALHLSDFESVHLVVLLGVVAQPAHIQFTTAGCLQSTETCDHTGHVQMSSLSHHWLYAYAIFK